MKTLWEYICESILETLEIEDFNTTLSARKNAKFRNNLFNILKTNYTDYCQKYNVRKHNKGKDLFLHNNDLYYVDAPSFDELKEETVKIIKTILTDKKSNVFIKSTNIGKQSREKGTSGKFQCLEIIFQNKLKKETIAGYIVNPLGERKGILAPKDILKLDNASNIFTASELYEALKEGLNKLNCKQELKNEALNILNSVYTANIKFPSNVKDKTWKSFLIPNNIDIIIPLNKELTYEDNLLLTWYSECFTPLILANILGNEVKDIRFPGSTTNDTADVYINGIEFSVKGGNVGVHAAAIRNMLLTKKDKNTWLPKPVMVEFHDKNTEALYKLIIDIFLNSDKHIRPVVELHSLVFKYVLGLKEVPNNIFRVILKHISEDEAVKLFTFKSYTDLINNLKNLDINILYNLYKDIYTFTYDYSKLDKDGNNKLKTKRAFQTVSTGSKNKNYYLSFVTDKNPDGIKTVKEFKKWWNNILKLKPEVVYGTFVYPLWVKAIYIMNMQKDSLTLILNMFTGFKTIAVSKIDNKTLKVKISSSKTDNWKFKAVASVGEPIKQGLSVEIRN